MKRILRHLARIAVELAIIVAVVVVAGWVFAFNWHECRKVGHSRLYCALSGGR